MYVNYAGPMGTASYSGGGNMGGSYAGGYAGGGGGGAGLGGGGIGAGGGRVIQHGGGGCCGSPVHMSGRSMGSGVYGGSYMGGGPAGGVSIEPTPGCGLGTGTADTGCCVGGPETQCGGVGSACLESSGNMVTTTDWSYVGQGRGGYSANPSYSYVGEGAGSYSKDVIVTPYGCRIKPCCLLLPLLALIPLLYYLFKPCGGMCDLFGLMCDACITPTPAPVGPIKECTIWGDPHIRTFDGARSDYYSSGEYWIVKSPNLWIQGRYLPTKMTNGLAVTKVIAIGGPIVKNGKLLISPIDAMWNGAPVLTGFPSSFNVPGVLETRYDNTGMLLQKGRAGKEKHIVHVKLFDGSPEGIMIQINRWTEAAEGNYVNGKITMHSTPGMDGHCGNFNNNAADDDRLQVRSRVGTTGVAPGDQFLFDAKTPVTQGNRPDINNCPPATLDTAKADCKKKYGGFIPPMHCLLDYCFAGKAIAMQG